MHILELTPAEQRVLGCLIEKRFTTPDQYPLTLNALRLACNQSTNRDPVVNYDEETVNEAAPAAVALRRRPARERTHSRAVKYRHLAEEGLGLDAEQLAVLCVLLLRGVADARGAEGENRADGDAQLARRTSIGCSASWSTTATRGALERRPGQKEDRFEQLLGEPGEPGGGGQPAGGEASSAPRPQTAIGSGITGARRPRAGVRGRGRRGEPHRSGRRPRGGARGDANRARQRSTSRSSPCVRRRRSVEDE